MDEANKKLSWTVGKKTVLCVGNTEINCISFVKQFPKVNLPKRSLKSYMQRGGHASINCTVLRNLGVDVEFFGVLNTSPIFKLLEFDMRQRNIKIENCPRCNIDPPFSSIVINKTKGTRNIVSCKKSAPYPTLEDFQKLDLSKYGWIHFRGRCPEVTLEMMRAVDSYNVAQTGKIIISMDMDTSLADNWPLVDYCDYVFFYRQLAGELNWKSPKEACCHIDEQLRMRYGLNLKRPFVVFLWNLHKVGLMDYHSNYSLAPGYKPKRFVENVGATEVFVGAFIYAIYVRKRSHEEAAEFANQMSAYKCTKCGFDHISNILVAPVL